MNKHEYKEIKKQFLEQSKKGRDFFFQFEINHQDDTLFFDIELREEHVFLAFNTCIVYDIRPSNNAEICERGVKYSLDDIEGDTLDKVIEFLNEEATQFLLDSNLLP